ncbi:MAG: hypothetical protein RL514_2988 [Verrucomicrobiota bacterium]|jgi:hypothetical protein
MKLNFTSESERALTFVETMFVVVLLLLLMSMLLPWLSASRNSRTKAERMKCHNIQRSMGLGFRVFANDNDEKLPFAVTNSLAFGNATQVWAHFQTMSNELGSARILICPTDRERLSNIKSDFGSGASGLASAGNAAVSFGTGLDADATQPKTILLIDRNLVTNSLNLREKLLLSVTNRPPPEWDQRMHKFCGNAALADGSVQQVSNTGLADLVRLQGIATNRLLLPLLP